MTTTDLDPDTELSESEAQDFRVRCVEFLEANATGFNLDGPDQRGEQRLRQGQIFQKKLHEAGLAGLTYPSQYGGQGLTKSHDRIWREECGNFPMMTMELTITHGMCLPMLSEYGTDEQKARFLEKNITAEEVWCQMFSEPGAGSDVASLQTKAELDGDEWLLNGQKVWTTLAHLCEYGIVIARTDPDQPKHRGISMFMVDMNAPGVEIRPIHQIDGGLHFNEVFFTDVRIPADWQLGPINEGWRLATSMLMYERVAIGTGATSGISAPTTERFIEMAKANGRAADPVVRDELMKMYSSEVAKSLVSMRTRANLQAGKTPGPGGSLGKLHGALIAAMTRDITPLVAGSDAMAWDSDASHGDRWAHGVLSSFQASIAGGTDEIQRNIIGDRVLGLPREPSVDKDVPFRDLKVGTQKS